MGAEPGKAGFHPEAREAVAALVARARAAQAAYEDGILTVELPLARASDARTVPIQQRSEGE